MNEELHRRHYDAHLEEILQELRTNVALLTDIVKRHDKEIGELKITMDGQNGRNGYNTRLELLEEDRERRTWHIRALWTALLSIVSAAVASWWFEKW